MTLAATRRVRCTAARLRTICARPGEGRHLGADEGAEETQPREVHCRGRVVDEVTWQRPRQHRRRRVLEIHPFKVALTVEDREPAHLPDRRAPMMPHDRIRDVAAPVTAQPRPVRQVDVLVRREKVLVEAAELLEHAARHQTRSAADAEHLVRLPGHVRGRAMVPLEGAAPSQHAVAGAVDHRRDRACTRFARSSARSPPVRPPPPAAARSHPGSATVSLLRNAT